MRRERMVPQATMKVSPRSTELSLGLLKSARARKSGVREVEKSQDDVLEKLVHLHHGEGLVLEESVHPRNGPRGRRERRRGSDDGKKNQKLEFVVAAATAFLTADRPLRSTSSRSKLSSIRRKARLGKT